MLPPLLTLLFVAVASATHSITASWSLPLPGGPGAYNNTNSITTSIRRRNDFKSFLVSFINNPGSDDAVVVINTTSRDVVGNFTWNATQQGFNLYAVNPICLARHGCKLFCTEMQPGSSDQNLIKYSWVEPTSGRIIWTTSAQLSPSNYPSTPLAITDDVVVMVVATGSCGAGVPTAWNMTNGAYLYQGGNPYCSPDIRPLYVNSIAPTGSDVVGWVVNCGQQQVIQAYTVETGALAWSTGVAYGRGISFADHRYVVTLGPVGSVVLAGRFINASTGNVEYWIPFESGTGNEVLTAYVYNEGDSENVLAKNTSLKGRGPIVYLSYSCLFHASFHSIVQLDPLAAPNVTWIWREVYNASVDFETFQFPTQTGATYLQAYAAYGSVSSTVVETIQRCSTTTGEASWTVQVVISAYSSVPPYLEYWGSGAFSVIGAFVQLQSFYSSVSGTQLTFDTVGPASSIAATGADRIAGMVFSLNGNGDFQAFQLPR